MKTNFLARTVVSLMLEPSVLVRLCANTVLITVLTPYVSPVVIPETDVQLFSLAVSVLVLLILTFLAPKYVTVIKADLYIFGLGILTLIYVDATITAVSMQDWLRGCAPIILGFPIYFAVRNLYRHMSPRVLVAVVALYFGVLVLQLTVPSVYSATVANMLSDVRWFPEEGRGPNGLCPEPSMMGNMCILFAISMYFFHREYWIKHRRAAWLVVAASGIMLIITKSGTGVMLAIATAILVLLNGKISSTVKISFVIGATALVIAVGSMLASSDERGASLLSLLVRNPVLVVQDPSLAARLLGVFVAVYQLPEEPFGTGDMRVDVDLTQRALNSESAVYLWPDPSLREVLLQLRQYHESNTGIGSMFQRMGVLGIACVVGLVGLVRGCRGKWVVRFFVVTLFLNASLFIPTLWFIIACCNALSVNDSAKVCVQNAVA